MAYSDLSSKHKVFVDSYINCLNYTKAYKDAFPNSGYNSQRAAGSELASKPFIKEAIVEKLKERLHDKSETLDRITKIIQFDVTDYLNDKLELDVDLLNRDGLGWMLKGVKHSKLGTEFLLMDKDRALENLAKISSLFNDNQTVNVNINNEISAKEQLQQKLNELDERFNRTK